METHSGWSLAFTFRKVLTIPFKTLSYYCVLILKVVATCRKKLLSSGKYLKSSVEGLVKTR